MGPEDLDQPARQRAGERWGWIWNPGEISIYVLNLVYPGSEYLQGRILTLIRFFDSDQKQIENIYRYQI